MKTRKKGGWVYQGTSTRKDGSEKTYIGMTRRSPWTRAKEHKDGARGNDSKSWTSKGTDFKLKSYFWSKNPREAEKTMKKKRKGFFG
jgi:hypothetical protein